MRSADAYREVPIDFTLIRDEVRNLGAIAERNPSLRQVAEAFYQRIQKCVDEAEQRCPNDPEGALQYLVAVLSRYYLADEWFPDENYAHMTVKPKRTPHSLPIKYAASKTLYILRKKYPEAFNDNQLLSASPNVTNFKEWEQSALNYFENIFPEMKRAG